MILPCFLGIQESVMQAVHEHRVDIYRTLDAKKDVEPPHLVFPV